MTEHEREENRPEGEEQWEEGREDSLEEDLFLSPDDDDGVVIDLDEDAPEDPAADEEEPENEASASEDAGDEDDELQEAEEDASEELRVRIAALEEEVAKAVKEKEEVSDRLLRAAADLENFRRRAEREKEELRKYGSDKVVSELLPAVDNMERALQHADERQEDSSLVEGIQMVYRQLLSALKKHGVEGFESRGEPFDPTRHEAIQQVESTEVDTGTVVEQYQKGYFLHDRLLRPALVSVAKRVQAPENEASTDDIEEAPSSPEPEGDAASPREEQDGDE